MGKTICIFTIIVFITLKLFSQNALDSLKINLQNSNGSKKAVLISNFYSRKDSLSNSLDFLNLAIKNVENKNQEIYYHIPRAYHLAKKHHLNKAYLLLDSCISVSRKLKSDSLIASGFYAKAEIFFSENNYKDAIINYYSALKIYEQLKDSVNITSCYNSIGSSYLELNEKFYYKKAITVFCKAYQIVKENPVLEEKFIELLVNIGVAFDGIGEKKIALEYYLKYYEKVKDNNNIDDILIATLNIGDSYRLLKNYPKAIEFTNKCMQIAEEKKDWHQYNFSKANLAEIYYDLGEYNKAISLLEKIRPAILGFEDNSLSQFYLNLLAKVYFNIGKYEESAKTYRTYIAFNDSVFNSKMKMKITEFEAKYENEKKEQRILLLEKNDELNQVQIKRQTFMRNSFIIGFFLMILFAVTIFIAYRIKRRDNNLLLIRNNEILLQKEEIKAQSENLELANKEITLQKEKTEQIHLELTDSIHYASNIQSAVLPQEDYINEIFSNYFILFKPKDIVSGDFIWVSSINNQILFCVADCTGHGVPGAFMSMLGIALLNEIVGKNEIIQANYVLNELRKRVIESLKQKAVYGEQKDGMDIAFCVLNKDTLELQFAGANNPLWTVKKVESYKVVSCIVESYKVESEKVDDTTLQTFELYELYELKGDNMPISIHPKMLPYTNHIIQLEKGDIIYLLSDGYQDQFGGENRKKYLSKNLKQLLMNNSNLPMEEQKEVLETTLIDWIGENEQIDDITVLGIKI